LKSSDPEHATRVRKWVRYVLVSVAVFVVGYSIFIWVIFEPR